MMQTRIRFLFVILFVCATVPMGAVTRRGLVIGLGSQQDQTWSKIHGDRDVVLVLSLLRDNGFTDIRTLMNSSATKKDITMAFLGLAQRCQEGDIVYVHYSGHGQLITDIDGDESLRFNSHHAQYDESWIPYDAALTYGGSDQGEKHLTDDEISVLLNAIRKHIGESGKLYVVVDACHSGDATRGHKEWIRGVDTPFEMPRQTQVKAAQSLPEEWLTISACKPYQVCFEHQKYKVGKLTHALYLLRDTFFEMTPTELTAALEKYMQENPSRLKQNPVISGKP